jgi:hypothetical protein
MTVKVIGPRAADRHAENSDVFPTELVAVAVYTAAEGIVTEKVAFPAASVVTFVAAMKVCPSPLPEGSHAVLPKISIEYVAT